MQWNAKVLGLAIVAGVGLLLAACAPVQPPSPSAAVVASAPAVREGVSGTIHVPADAEIPDGSVVVVDLLDLTAWTPALSVTYTTTSATFPLAFALAPAGLSADGAYGVAARVVIDGSPRYLTPEPTPVGAGVATDLSLNLVSNYDMLAPEPDAVSGTLTKLDRMALPAGTVVVVDLLDLETWTPVATDTYTTTGEQVPLPFDIGVPADAVHAEGVYGLVGRLLIDGRPMFVTMEPTPLQAGGQRENIELMLTSNADMLATEPGTASKSAVTGTVTYRQRMALPAGAVITVRLQDVSRQDVAATLISEQVITTAGEQVPIAFSLPYDPAQIDERFTYSVSARVEIGGKLAWISDTMTPVITRGAPTSNVEVMLVPVK